MSFDYDLFVIGGGSGGVRAARLTAADGFKVAMAEEFRMGGTCVIRGCVPKKLMVFASSFNGAMQDAEQYGWSIEKGAFDWAHFQAKMKAELTRLEGIYTRNAGNAGVEILHQRARVKDAHTVCLADGREVSAKHILIAVGGTPFMPKDLPGIEHAITSNEIFDLEQLPKRIAVVGGGYIACEFACIMNGLGSEVVHIHRGETILRGFDSEAASLIGDMIVHQGIDLRLNTDIEKIEKLPNGEIAITTKSGDVITVDQVLFATGRMPKTQDLGLENIGLELAKNGAVPVNEYGQTAVPSVYAVGDVTDRLQLTPVAIREAVAFHETVFKGNPSTPDHVLVPSAVFTQPEYGVVGLSEEDARKQGPIEVYGATFRPMQNSFIDKDQKVLFKLVVCATSQKILGCHIVAPNAGEMIQFAGICVKMGATKADFDATVAVHPTMAEEIVLLKTPLRT